MLVWSGLGEIGIRNGDGPGVPLSTLSMGTVKVNDGVALFAVQLVLFMFVPVLADFRVDSRASTGGRWPGLTW